MIDKQLLDGGYFAQPLHTYIYFQTFFFKGFFPVDGYIVIGVITCHKHERNQRNLFRFVIFELLKHGVESRITLDSAYMKIFQSFGFQHVVDHCISGGTGGVGSMTHKYYTSFFRFACTEDIYYCLSIFYRIEQRVTYPDLFKKRATEATSRLNDSISTPSMILVLCTMTCV